MKTTRAQFLLRDASARCKRHIASGHVVVATYYARQAARYALILLGAEFSAVQR